jgi:hypothetical protein
LSRRKPNSYRLERLRLQQGPDPHGAIREAGYEHPHGFVKLETPGKIWLVVLAPTSRMENRGDEGRHLHEAAEESNLH